MKIFVIFVTLIIVILNYESKLSFSQVNDNIGQSENNPSIERRLKCKVINNFAKSFSINPPRKLAKIGILHAIAGSILGGLAGYKTHSLFSPTYLDKRVNSDLYIQLKTLVDRKSFNTVQQGKFIKEINDIIDDLEEECDSLKNDNSREIESILSVIQTANKQQAQSIKNVEKGYKNKI